MRIRDIKDITREDISDFAWKWRCKILPNREQAAGRDIEDIEDSFSEDDPKKPPPNSKDPTFGADAIVKTFYEGKNSVGRPSASSRRVAYA